MNQILAQAENQRVDAMKRKENNLACEKMQTEASQKREQALMKIKAESDEATRKREQLFMDHKLKRQKMLVDAQTALNQEKMKTDINKEIASLEAFERRELEFQQL